MFSNILIIDKRIELSTKYKKSLENSNIYVEISRNLKDAMNNIQNSEPDMIIISDSIDEKLTNFCEKIRVLTYNTRPTIIALSKSADTQDRISVLESGADDFLSEPVNIDEFKIRIQAHLRRDIESNLDTKTLLPNRKFTLKFLKRILNTQKNFSVLLVSIENLKNYKEVYSEVAGDKVIQTLIAIIKSTIDSTDFLGQINNEEFIIITNEYTAEKMANFLTFAFDTVVPKFYSKNDNKRGYTLLKGDRHAGMRSNFVSLLIGGILSTKNTINNIESLLERLDTTKNLAKVPSRSNYVIDRLKLSGEINEEANKLSNEIFIKEHDEALKLLLRTTLELQGYDVIENMQDTNLPPMLMILDSGDDLSELRFCEKIKQNKNFVNTKIIVTSTVHDKTTILNSGADLYLPKPYEISDLIRWVEFFKKNHHSI